MKCPMRFEPNGIHPLDAVAMRLYLGYDPWNMVLTLSGTPTGDHSKSSIEADPDPKWGCHDWQSDDSLTKEFGKGWEVRRSGKSTSYRNNRLRSPVFGSKPQIQRWLSGQSNDHDYDWQLDDSLTNKFGELGSEESWTEMLQEQ